LLIAQPDTTQGGT